ncbi:MAG: MBL fold metallo-hydrolase [Candidatus Sericytochromatia bacterium]|nr:MBL fold metallo-hydrolase [Candidatus Sericytochromatia bacterium]
MTTHLVRETFAVGPLGCNCSIIGNPATGEAVIVDPGAEPDRVMAALARLGFRPVAILITHAHFDHVGGLAELQKTTGVPIHMHEGDRPLYENLDLQTSLFGMAPIQTARIDRWAVDGDRVTFGDLVAEVLHTPGHTPGSLSFHVNDATPLLLTGDTLFSGSVGRSDLWGGDHDTLIRAIRDKLLVFPDDAIVVPGHGPETTIGIERRYNRFLRIED